jgi:MarR family transcriptional regulator for hemolysin
VLEYDFEQSAGYWLCTTWQVYQRAINEELAPQGITFRQCQVLGCLALEGELSQSELAERMRIEPPTLVGILDRMERDGWIRRRTPPDDRRKKLICPAEAAGPVWSTIVACAKRVRSRATKGFSKKEKSLLRELLERIQQNLGAEISVRESVES